MMQEAFENSQTTSTAAWSLSIPLEEHSVLGDHGWTEGRTQNRVHSAATSLSLLYALGDEGCWPWITIATVFESDNHSTCCAFLVVWEYVWDTLPKHRFRCLARACRAKLRRAHEQSSEAAKHSCKWETVWQFHNKWTNEVAAATSSFYCPLAPTTTNAEITSCA